ncbi:oxalate decarboxylase-like protein [Cadophora sp. MPI-SDFR-AT-0126]|nr:oxalate decarboxylase-like protein [Leotiomycetes sp. MPI-SDFR-AT-0126]
MALCHLAAVLLAIATMEHTLAAPTLGRVEPSSLLGYNPANKLVFQDTDAIEFETAPGQNDDANIGASLDFTTIENPQPFRGSKGGLDPGPRTLGYDRLNPDKLAPPGTDSGSVANAEWPMGLSHVKMGRDKAGWSREQNVEVLPEATAMAGVNMRLEPNAYRELHWHSSAEWAYVMNGTVRIQTVNEAGETFVDDLSAGDVWFFPAGVPHSLQALGGGTEFLLIFDDGSFSEDSTFLISEVFAHNPKEVLSKNFALPISAWDNIPSGELFIFPGTPAPEDISLQNETGSAGVLPLIDSYSFHLSEAPNTFETEGGSVKIIDPTTFPIAAGFSAAIVTVKPGALREIHWHTTSDEWNFFLAGDARITVFASQGNARTFNYHAGDCGYIPKDQTHYIENIGTTDVLFIEVLQAPIFSDISVAQWVGLTSPQIIKDTLKLSDETVASFKKEKQYVVAGTNSTA